MLLLFQVSTLGVGPFFVENISEIQLNAMKLVTTVSSLYCKT
jgi:cohesin loading factor subunit SCC2